MYALRFLSASIMIVFAAVGCLYDNPNTIDPPEDIANLNPLRVLPAVTKFAGAGAKLVEFEAPFVRSDGTVDLTADYADFSEIEYDFIRPHKADPDLPVGAGGGAKFENVTISIQEPKYHAVTRKRGGFTSNYTEHHKGMEIEVGSSRSSIDRVKFPPAPTCDLEDLWKQAIAAGAPDKGVATIEFDRDGYEFNIDEIDFEREFDHNCRPKPE